MRYNFQRNLYRNYSLAFFKLNKFVSSDDSSKGNSVQRYLQQQEELQKRFKNVKKISLKKPDAKIIQRTPKKRRKKIKLGTETVDESPLKSDGPLLSERMTIDFEEQSGSEYYPSDESVSSEELGI